MHKISPFADDIVIMLLNPKDAILVLLMKELHNYGKVAGFNINESKSEIMYIDILTGGF